MKLTHRVLNHLTGKHVLYTSRIELLSALLNMSGSSLTRCIEQDMENLIKVLIADCLSEDSALHTTIRVEPTSIQKHVLWSLLDCLDSMDLVRDNPKRYKKLLVENSTHLPGYSNFAVNDVTRRGSELVDELSSRAAYVGVRLTEVIDKYCLTERVPVLATTI